MGPRQRSSGAGLALVAAVVVVGFLVLRSRPTNPIPPGPSPSTSPSAVAIASELRTLAPTPPPTPDPTPTLEPPSPVADDGTFRLELSVLRDTYDVADVIVPSATLTFLGPDAKVTYGHADPAVFFTIEQLDGDAQMGGGADDLCALTTAVRGQPVPVAFHKSGQVDLGFDLAWYRDPILRLPAGLWRIGVSFEGDLPACEPGSTIHELHADRVISVRGSSTVGASSGADASTAVTFTRKFVDAITTGHAVNAWAFLSPWSQTSIGSVSRLQAILPQRRGGALDFDVGPATNDPELMGPDFLGQRWEDLAAKADLSRGFVVPVRDALGQGAAAGTMNLVAAPLLDDGTWRIWLDRTGR